MNLSMTEQLCYSTVRIECEYTDGRIGTGTGFFFSFKEDVHSDKCTPVVITNKHVVSGAIKGRLILTKANSNYEPLDRQHFKVNINHFEALWKKHPDDIVDLCAMPMAPIHREAEKQGVNLFYMRIPKTVIPTPTQISELSALEDIIMVGYPDGIWDYINNKPILRKGVTATHPSFDYCGRKEIMIDMACFPGSSGSPVFIINEGGYTDKRGNTYLGTSRALLLGILCAGPLHPIEGEVQIVDVPMIRKPISISNIPNNLGIIIKSERINELEMLF